MNTKNIKNYEMLARFAGQDESKLKLAEVLAWEIEAPITRAQAKVIMSYDARAVIHMTKDLIAQAVELHEPVFIETAIEAYFASLVIYKSRYQKNRYTCLLSTALQYLTETSKREILKSVNNALALIDVILKAIEERKRVYEYALYHPMWADNMCVDNPYKAAWVIVNGDDKEVHNLVTDYELFTLKQLKTALKNVERIDRYAQIKHIEYDYSSGIAKEVKGILDNCQIPDFTPIYFQKSEDMADEGEHMQNCIAGSWHVHTVDSFYCACIYKGTRMDIEIGKDIDGSYIVYQLFEKSNSSTARTVELTAHINTALDAAWSIEHAESIKVRVEYVSACDDICLVNAATGEVVVEDYEGVVIDKYEYIVGCIKREKVIFRITCDVQIELGSTLVLKNVTGTEEAKEALDELENIHNMFAGTN